MKTTLVVLFVLLAATAFGQQSAPVLSNQISVTHFSDHPEHAEPHAMAAENPIAGGAADVYSYAQGEIPLWQLGPLSEPVPLGESRVLSAKRNRQLEKLKLHSRNKAHNSRFDRIARPEARSGFHHR